MEPQQNTEKENSVAKRAAFAGQWRTPPLPVFPTNSNTMMSTTEINTTTEPTTTTQQSAQMLPSSTEDYVKALQEAYLRGAEAAAALAQQQQQQQTINTATSCPEFATQSSSVVPLYPTATPLVTTSTTSMPPPRSLSVTELYPSAAEHAPPTHDEEIKRQKRLARNRASARLRRLRKKNLVDAYEAEVKGLERILQKLQTHVWGHPDSDVALLEALSMERGQLELTGTQRHQAALEIVQQQVEFLSLLQEMMQEQYILYQVATTQTNEEWQELSQLLQLSNEQKEALQAQAAGWHEEYQALQTVLESLQAMRDNHWLWNNGVAEMAEQFMQILHKNQVSKFLSWADHNWDALDELDFTSASSSNQTGPVFQFGVDSMPTDEK
jgi:hypothetical protein